jgi:hypothetical protein
MGLALVDRTVLFMVANLCCVSLQVTRVIDFFPF